MYLSKLYTLLFQPKVFFENKKEEKLFWSLLYFIILSSCTGLSSLLMRLLLAIDSHMDLELFQEFFSPLIVIFTHDTMYLIIPTLIVALLTQGLFLGKEKKGILKTLMVFFYAQTPLFLFLLLNYLLLGLSFLPRLIFQDISFSAGMWGVVIPIYSITPLIGIFWMSIISMNGITVLYGKTGSRREWRVPIFITTTLLVIMILMGFFPWTGVSYDKLTTETLKISSDETVFASSDGKYSNYKYNDLGISFLFPSFWYVNTTKTVKQSRIQSYDLLFYDPGEKNYDPSSLMINDSGNSFKGTSTKERDFSQHSFNPLTITASFDNSKSIDTMIKKMIYDQKILGYTLVNQSPVHVGNKTGTHFLFHRISSQQELAYFFYGQPITRTGEPKVRDISEIIWIETDNMRYYFHLSAPVEGYGEYHQIFNDILNSTVFLVMSFCNV